MKHIAYPLLLSVLFFSFCKNAKKEDLKIKILNTEIYSRGNIQDKEIRNIISYDNYMYDSIPVNKITIKISNTGTKKYAFFIKKELDKVQTRLENIKSTVLKNDEIIEPTYLGLAIGLTNKGFEMRKYRNEKDNDSLKEELNEKYLKEKIDKDKIKFQREMNYVVIHPGETKYFSYYRTSPIFLENLDSYYMYKFNTNENYYFQLSFKNDAEELKKNCTINQIKEIEENGYEIFNGVIKSNKVPIKFISM